MIFKHVGTFEELNSYTCFLYLLIKNVEEFHKSIDFKLLNYII